MVRKDVWVWGMLALIVLTLASQVRGEEEEEGEAEEKEKEQPKKGAFVGIDLGTTFSAVGTWRHGGVEIIPNEMGHRITPSIVAFTESERLIGDGARNQLAANPQNTIYSIKRLIGKKFKDIEVQRDIGLLPYKVVEDKVSGKPVVQVKYKDDIKQYSSEEVSSMVLSKMKHIAETFLGGPVTDAVITVPAYFNDGQRQSTKDAGLISGLNVLRIINEPTAAALAYGLNKKGERKIMVFDLGGGTFDVSLLTIDDGFFEVVATDGDTHLGGEDFDNRVVKHMAQVIKKKHGKDVRGDPRAVARLKQACEDAKRQLSNSPEARIEIDNIADGIDVSEKLTRAKFEELNMEMFKRTLEPVKKVLKAAKLEPEAVDDVVLVGGSTRIPKVQSLLKDFFGGKEPSKGINPDEAVAYGATVQAAVLAGEEDVENKVLLVDVTALSVGIETVGGIMSKIISRNTPIPAKKSKQVTTNAANQKKLLIQVFEGERAKTKDNRMLGKFELTDIPPAPRGKPKIDIQFEIDENGILEVTAKDKDSGKRESITIAKDKGSLSQAEIDKMIGDAEKFEEEDKALQAKIDERNALETFAYNLRMQINDEDRLGNKMGEEDKGTIEKVVQEALDWLDNNSNPTFDESREQYQVLEKACKPLIEKVYAEVAKERAKSSAKSAEEGAEGGAEGGSEEDYNEL